MLKSGRGGRGRSYEAIGEVKFRVIMADKLFSAPNRLGLNIVAEVRNSS